MNQTGNWKQGKYDLKHPEKYKGTLPVIYRSSWEHRVFYFLDNNDAILQWASETIVINYKSQIDNKMHRYFVDVNFVANDLDGNQLSYLIEIKPFDQTIPPKLPVKKSQKAIMRYNQAALTYQKNQDKWLYAREWARKNGYIFDIWTEKTLGLDN